MLFLVGGSNHVEGCGLYNTLGKIVDDVDGCGSSLSVSLGRSVKLLGVKSASLNLFWLKGNMPVFSNPFTMLLGVKVKVNAMRTIPEISCLVIAFPALFRIHAC